MSSFSKCHRNKHASSIITGFQYLKGDIIMIPGFRGSKIVDSQKQNKPVWVNLSLPFKAHSKKTFDLPLHIRKNEPDRYVPNGVLRKVAFYKYYDRFMGYIESLQQDDGTENQIDHSLALEQEQEEKSVENTIPTEEDSLDRQPFQFHEFSYDWRRSNETNVEKFLEYISKIYSSNGNKPVYVFAHSNGGLITLSSLHRQPHLFAGIIFAGTPFHGAPGVFRDMKLGIPILLNKHLQDSAAHFALRTIWGFLPWTLKAFKDSKTDQDLEIDYFDPKVWLENDWFDVVHEDTERNLELGTKEERIAYMEWVLDDTKKFDETLKCRGAGFKYPPIAALLSKAHPTTGGWPIDVIEGADGTTKYEIQYKNRIAVGGDGTVPFECAHLPEGIPFEAILSQNPHSELLEDLESVGKAIEIVFTRQEKEG